MVRDSAGEKAKVRNYGRKIGKIRKTEGKLKVRESGKIKAKYGNPEKICPKSGSPEKKCPKSGSPDPLLPPACLDNYDNICDDALGNPSIRCKCNDSHLAIC